MVMHYLPVFTRTDGVRQEAACGSYIFPLQHSPEPTCPLCRKWLGVDEELMDSPVVSPAFLPPDFWEGDIGPCATKGCIGLARNEEQFCLSCLFKKAQGSV
jgi:hypothetical protein